VRARGGSGGECTVSESGSGQRPAAHAAEWEWGGRGRGRACAAGRSPRSSSGARRRSPGGVGVGGWGRGWGGGGKVRVRVRLGMTSAHSRGATLTKDRTAMAPLVYAAHHLDLDARPHSHDSPALCTTLTLTKDRTKGSPQWKQSVGAPVAGWAHTSGLTCESLTKKSCSHSVRASAVSVAIACARRRRVGVLVLPGEQWPVGRFSTVSARPDHETRESAPAVALLVSVRRRSTVRSHAESAAEWGAECTQLLRSSGTTRRQALRQLTGGWWTSSVVCVVLRAPVVQ
jgi:hypothetical protein